MLHFENPTMIHLHRPVTVVSVAQALDVKPFELLAELIGMQVFVAPHQGIDDDTVFRLGKRIGVDFRIDEDGGSSPIVGRPIGPTTPDSLFGSEELTSSPPGTQEAR
jgi:hypothetical protein